MDTFQLRARYYGYREGETSNQMLNNFQDDATHLDATCNTLIGSLSSLHVSSMWSEMAQLWGEPPISGILTSYTTSTTLVLAHDSSALWPATEGTMIGNITFPSAAQTTIYSVFATLATQLGVVCDVPNVTHGYLSATDTYRVERWNPLVADIQALRFNI